MAIKLKEALTYGVGFALMTALIPTLIPAIWTVPFVGITLGGIVYYGVGYGLITMLGNALKVL